MKLFSLVLPSTTPSSCGIASSANFSPPSTFRKSSDATRRHAAGRRKPPISVAPIPPRPLPTIDPQQTVFVRLRKFLPFSSRTSAAHSGRNDQPRDPLDFSSTLPLPRPLSGHTSTQGRPDMNSGECVSVGYLPSHIRHILLSLNHYQSLDRLPPHPPHSHPAYTSHHPGGPFVDHAQSRNVDVPLAQAKERNAAADAPKKDEDIVPRPSLTEP
ncbi:hypothetical protein F4604DRAFT_1194052 [Suillus subluteus]|nr:hypothetical protein F4604DRAFT_1194052 [Suillus subluteus]